jgi:SAM-dependent methyltransferase
MEIGQMVLLNLKMFNKYNWISALDIRNEGKLRELQNKMADFYSNNYEYFNKINFTEGNWANLSPVYEYILGYLNQGKGILEVGSGRANILKHQPHLRKKYVGLDFSKELAIENTNKYPGASFRTFADPKSFPFKDQVFDVVFSINVLEHTVFPHKFLDESLRVLKSNGFLVVLFPDFTARKNITSQKVGFSVGSGREKIKQRKLIDGIVTIIDNKVIMPGLIKYFKLKAKNNPLFMINLNPMCFNYDFYPDLDATYLTNSKEINLFLKDKVEIINLPTQIQEYIRPKNVTLSVYRKLDWL